MTVSNNVLLTWRNITFDSTPRSTFFINKLVGWLALPGANFQTEPTAGHGGMPTPGVQQERVIQAEGFIFCNQFNRDDLIDQLTAEMVPLDFDDDSTEPLRVECAKVGTAQAQLAMFEVPTEPSSWASGAVPWKGQWHCPDPLIYGDTRYATTLLAVPPGGLTPPFTSPATPPAQPLGGTIKEWNPGRARSRARFILTGESPGNVGLIFPTIGKRVSYDFGLGIDDTLLIDTELGGAYLNGEYRPAAGFSNIAADLRLAPQVVNVIRATGTTGAGTPSLTVAFEPASW